MYSCVWICIIIIIIVIIIIIIIIIIMFNTSIEAGTKLGPDQL